MTNFDPTYKRFVIVLTDADIVYADFDALADARRAYTTAIDQPEHVMNSWALIDRASMRRILKTPAGI